MTQPPAQQNQKAQWPDADWRDDEISLVDLAVILIRRWKAMAVIFFVVVALAVAAAFLLPSQYQYSSLYSVAEYTNSNGQRVAIESPASVVAKTENLYLGPETRKLLEENDLESLPFEVEASNPSNTLLLQLSSDATQENQKLVATLHQHVIDRLQADQAELVERRKASLERQLASAKQALESARESDSPSAAELIATYYSRISDIEGQLNELREGKITQHAVQSLEPVGVSKKIFIAVGSVLGIMLAIICVLVMQFSGSVYRNLRDHID